MAAPASYKCVSCPTILFLPRYVVIRDLLCICLISQSFVNNSCQTPLSNHSSATRLASGNDHCNVISYLKAISCTI